MSDVTEIRTSAEFSVLVLITFFTENRYSWIRYANLAGVSVRFSMVGETNSMVGYHLIAKGQLGV